MTNLPYRDFPGKVVIRSDGTAQGTRVSVIGDDGEEHDIGVTDIVFKLSVGERGDLAYATITVPAPKLATAALLEAPGAPEAAKA